jgi:crotonobetainyl-CoA:carnitine CoA-transferase CaiB-like acyl-CoA transferase
MMVLDLTNFVAGPYCTMMLGDMGVEVIKIEMPTSGDDSRKIGPPFLDGESTYFLSINRNKKSLTLNLKTNEGRKILHELVRKADVVVENFRPKVVDQLGADFKTLSSINPKIVYCSISGFGQDGPYRDRAAYDLIVLGWGGVLYLTGQESEMPTKPGIAFSDIIAGMFAAYAIVSALLARERLGKGQYIDVSLLDGQIAMLAYQAHIYFATGKSPERMGNEHPTIVPYGVYATKDGHVTLAVGNDRIWQRLCSSLNLDDMVTDPRFRTNVDRLEHRFEVDQAIVEKLAKMSTAEALDLFERGEVPSGPILSVDKVVSDPQVLHRKMVTEIRHKTLGAMKILGVPVKLSLTPGSVSSPPPVLGEHTEEVLKSIGYSIDKIKELKEKHVV